MKNEYPWGFYLNLEFYSPVFGNTIINLSSARLHIFFNSLDSVCFMIDMFVFFCFHIWMLMFGQMTWHDLLVCFVCVLSIAMMPSVTTTVSLSWSRPWTRYLLASSALESLSSSKTWSTCWCTMTGNVENLWKLLVTQLPLLNVISNVKWHEMVI